MPDVIDNNRFAPPRAELVEPGSLTDGPVLAGRGLRLVAVILDGLLMALISYPLFFLFGGASFIHMDPAAMRDPFAIMGAMFRASLPGYIAIIAIQVWCLHAYGGTMAKKLLGLRIVRTDGSRASTARLFFLRGGAAVVPLMIPLVNIVWWLLDPLLIFRDSRRCLHDDIADTIVVTAASSTNASLEASRAR
jgi:uncharacterized RDD family membrane protein YckC